MINLFDAKAFMAFFLTDTFLKCTFSQQTIKYPPGAKYFKCHKQQFCDPHKAYILPGEEQQFTEVKNKECYKLRTGYQGMSCNGVYLTMLDNQKKHTDTTFLNDGESATE